MNLGKTECENDVVCLGSSSVPELSSAEQRQERRMSGQDAKVPVCTRNLHLVNLFTDECAVGGYDLQLNVARKRQVLISSPGFFVSASGCLTLLEAFQDFVDCPHHIEVLFGNRVVLAFNDLSESSDGVGNCDVLALEARELLGHKEWL